MIDERAFFDERNETKPASLHCPHCRQANEYDIVWIVRRKKAQLPRGAGEQDRERFAKLRDYMVRRDDMVMCKNMRCRKRFEITGQSVLFSVTAPRAAGDIDDDNFGNR